MDCCRWLNSNGMEWDWSGGGGCGLRDERGVVDVVMMTGSNSILVRMMLLLTLLAILLWLLLLSSRTNPSQEIIENDNGDECDEERNEG